MTKITQELIYM